MTAPSAAAAHGFGDRPPARPRARLSAVRIVKRGGLVCFVDVIVGRLKLFNVAVFTGARGPFVSLPQAPILDENGTQKRVDGRRLYQPTVMLTTPQARERFSTTVLELLRKEHPELLAHQAALPLDTEEDAAQ
jgi:hypothetical protein